ncbi:MAG: hypothetical protein NXI04_11695 [Planctomycetaceae bacterium]|nr:hypothetical protein [Planctomycetaceae bacterium]
MRYSTPAHVANGLRQLVTDLQAWRQGHDPGLDGVVCGRTDLIGFYPDRVEYSGCDVAELVADGQLESVVWLLLNREPADPEQLADTCSILSDCAVVDEPAAEMMTAMPLQVRALDLLPLCVSMLACFDPTPNDVTIEASHSRFWRLLGQLPVLLHVAFGGKLHDGRTHSPSDEAPLTYAGRLLQILRQDSKPPSPLEEQAMNAVLICECLTEMRPACFSSRIFGSVVPDVVGGLKSAVSMFTAQLRNDPFAWMATRFRSFQSPDHAQAWFEARKSPTMPFGFQDAGPDYRSTLLRAECRELLGSIESIVMESSAARLESVLAERGLYPTVDWTAARLLTLLQVPEDRVSLAIGIARLVGWAAQGLEQHQSGVPLLPSLRYADDAAEDLADVD